MLVSVVMPVYNSGRFLNEAIQSVLRQTFTAFELLVVDDGSTDSSKEIVNRAAAGDHRVKIAWQDHKGVIAARNFGVAQAQSEFVALMDSDDRMHDTRLARQMDFLREHPDVAVCSTWAYLIDARGKRIGTSNHSVDVVDGRRAVDPSKFLEIINPSVMFRKTAFLDIGGYRDIGPLEDRDLWGRIATRGHQIVCMKQYLLDYRLHGGSYTVALPHPWQGHYIDINVARRLRGEEEISLEAYQKLRKALPVPAKLALWCNEASKTSYKQSVRELGEGHLLKCAAAAARAAALRPGWALGRVYSALRGQSD